MRFPVLRRLLLLLFWSFLFCSSYAATPATVLLVSFDGFRWDYFNKVPTPNFDRLTREGVKAKALIPPFPTETFPSHYSMVTGLHPEKHGIVGNGMRDPNIPQDFSFLDSSTLENPAWWLGEPIWGTVQRQGLRSATCFWPGSTVKIAGTRPTYWLKYDSAFPNEKRIEQVIEWLSLPAEKRPHFVTLYFSDVDKAGHDHGPDSAEMIVQIEKADKLLGQLLDRLAAINQSDVNIIVVSDHGMAQLSQERIIPLKDFLTDKDLVLLELALLASGQFSEAEERYLMEKLAKIPHATFYTRDKVPERLHFQKSNRIGRIVAVIDEGWTILPTKDDWKHVHMRGNHGFDNELPSMHGIFLARGPAFPKGLAVEPFLNVNVYGLIAKILRVTPAPNDGDDKVISRLLITH